MHKLRNTKISFQFGFLLIILGLGSCIQHSEKVDNLQYVDPQIGGVAPFLQPTRTRMHIPNSMVRMYPNRKDYRDDQIRSFPLIVRNHRSQPLFNILPIICNYS